MTLAGDKDGRLPGYQPRPRQAAMVSIVNAVASPTSGLLQATAAASCSSGSTMKSVTNPPQPPACWKTRSPCAVSLTMTPAPYRPPSNVETSP